MGKQNDSGNGTRIKEGYEIRNTRDISTPKPEINPAPQKVTNINVKFSVKIVIDNE